jgi:ketosteroid isomerase-like protein
LKRLLIIILLLCGCASVPRADDAATIRDVLDTTAIAWNRGDLNGYLAAYDEAITSRSATGFVTGKEPAAEVMRQGFWKTGRPLQQLHYEHVDVRKLGADYALVTGEFVLTGADKPERTGWFTTVWKRTALGWRMMHDHS